MARYPGAIWKPITADKLYGPGTRERLTTYNRVNLHSTASTASSQFGYFNQSGIPDSHFHVDYDGTVEQYVDTDWQAFADYEGSDATVSIETAGVSQSTGDEEWRPAQLAAIVKLVAWIIREHDIKRQLATSSKAGFDSSKGLSWHRLGIDGNFPALPSIQAGRLQRGGGMHYSKSFGKVCPGYKRITQIHREVWPQVKALLEPKPVPIPTPEEDMPTAKEIADAIWSRQAKVPSNLVPFLGEFASMEDFLQAIAFRVQDIEVDVDTAIQELRAHNDPDVNP